MVDEATPGFWNVTIASGAALTFDPEVEMEFRAANIFVDGRLEIGSETCPYIGKLIITLTGMCGQTMCYITGVIIGDLRSNKSNEN